MVDETESHLRQTTEKSSSDQPIVDVKRKPRTSQPSKASFPEPEKRVSRKPSRHTSHGSQKVDIHGSPVPHGMLLQERATVLETFSQQAGLSSTALPEDAIISRKITGVHELESATASQLGATSHQPEIMSSNVKPRPAEPGAQSQAITRIVRADSRRLYIEDQSGSPSTDPFTSSEENRKQPRQGSTSSTFLEQLRRETQNHHSIESNFQRRDEDPDKTLVEPQQNFRPPKRMESLSTLSSSPSSAESDESTASMRDLAIWRSALQPHQMTLFDELVIVSHRLVQHLVDRETAATDIVDDYYRRGLNLVEQMELNHARQHQKYVDALKERKKRLRKGFNDCSKKLNDAVAPVASAQRERTQSAKAHEDKSEKLQRLMANFC